MRRARSMLAAAQQACRASKIENASAPAGVDERTGVITFDMFTVTTRAVARPSKWSVVMLGTFTASYDARSLFSTADKGIL